MSGSERCRWRIAVEETPQWRDDAARAADGQPVTHTRKDLQERGWTATMITQLLSIPDLAVALNTSETRTLHLWRAARVEEAERGEKFAERMLRGARRAEMHKAVARRRAAEVDEAAHARAKQLTLTPPRTMVELRTQAIAAQQAWYTAIGRHDGDPDGADEQTMDRWCRSYLRHQCSTYDTLLEDIQSEFRSTPGVTGIYGTVVRPRIDLLVEEAMTSLVSDGSVRLR